MNSDVAGAEAIFVGKYFYYGFLEDQPRRSDARAAKLEPAFIKDIRIDMR
ncbi:MAG: hypothetical protein WC028_13795 [Candidatus Obscuribacterales bacterium]